jgi:ketosteroid isomerase-like protein
VPPTAFAEAWRHKDVDGLMALVTDDIVYAASVGCDRVRPIQAR